MYGYLTLKSNVGDIPEMTGIILWVYGTLLTSLFTMELQDKPSG
jgi:hypothetical protein